MREVLEDIQFKVLRSHVKIPVIFLAPALFLATLYVMAYLLVNSAWAQQELLTTISGALGNEIEVGELVIGPSLDKVHIYEGSMGGKGRERIIQVEQVHVDLALGTLLAKRLEAQSVEVVRPRVKMHMYADGSMELLYALGFEGGNTAPDDPNEPPSEMPITLLFDNVQIEDGHFTYILDEIFEMEVPGVQIVNGSVSIDNINLQMSVERAEADRGKLRFYHELFGFDSSYGDWTFEVDRFRVDEWRWSNFVFNAERVRGFVDGHEVDAHGQMAILDSAETISYKAEATIRAPIWSPLTQYFVEDYIHYSVPEMTVSGEGTLLVVDSKAHLKSDYLEVYGMKARDIEADIRLHNSYVEITDGVMHGYGGKVDIENAYFDMFQLVYGGEGCFDGVNPRGVLADLDGELTFVDGKATGCFKAIGKVPPNLAPDPELRGTMLAHATERWADVVFTSDLVLERANRELIPAKKMTITEGSAFWVDIDRVGVTEATFKLDQDRLDVRDLVLDYADYTLRPTYQDWGMEATARLADIGPYMEHYKIKDVTSGPATVKLWARGPLLAPDAKMQISVAAPNLGAKLAGDSLEGAFSLTAGTLEIKDLTFKSPTGRADLSGSVGLVTRSKEPDPEWDLVVYQPRRSMPLDIDARINAIDLAALAPLLPADYRYDMEGKVNAIAKVSGTDRSMMACVNASAPGGLKFEGERLSRFDTRLVMRDRGVTAACPLPGHGPAISQAPKVRTIEVEQFDLEHVGAGALEITRGTYRFDDTFEVALEARDFELGRLNVLSSYGLRGASDISLHASGSIDEPFVGGSIRSGGLKWGAFDLGKLALAVSTTVKTIEVPDLEPYTERIVHLNGALLPWFSLAAEIPIGDDFDYYARVGFERFDLLQFLDQTGLARMLGPELELRLERLGGARATGNVEFFLPRSLESLNITASLPSLRIGKGLGLRNDGLVSASYTLPLSEGIGGSQVVIQDFGLGRRGKFLHVGGSLTPEDLFLDLSLSGELDLALINLLRNVYPEYMPTDLLEARGAVGLDGLVRGTPEQLLVEGQMNWSKSEFRLRGFSDPLVVGGGIINFASDQIAISKDDALVGSFLGGDFSIHGAIGLENFLPTTLDLKLWTDNISYSSPGVANVTLDTDLTFRAEKLLELDTWKVSGMIEFIDGLFYQNISVFERELTGRILGAFDRKTEVYEASIFDEFPELGEMEFDLGIVARDGFKLKNQIERFALDLEFRIGLRLANTLENPQLTGDIEVIDGVVLFQGERFNVTTGVVRFSGNPSNPYIDVVAVADITNACSATAEDDQFTGTLALNGAVTTSDETREETYQISLNVRGTPDNLNIVYNSNPFADQRDIISLILTGCTVDLLTASSASQPTLETLLGPLIGRLEREIQEFVSVEEFNIVPGIERAQVRISDNLTRRLSWQFQLDKSFNEASSTGQTSKLEYQFTEQLSAQASESTYSDLNTSNRFQIDLRLKLRIPLD
jgi:hypothetical protein